MIIAFRVTKNNIGWIGQSRVNFVDGSSDVDLDPKPRPAPAPASKPKTKRKSGV